MIEKIKKIALTNKEKEEEKDDIDSINDLKTAYQILLDTNYINPTNRDNFLDNTFSQVQIEPEKSQLIKKKWKRIYTFNIDDAIESVRRDFQVICPFKEVSVEYVRGHNCLMKIHGDINEYKKYNNTSIIFSWLEYAKSIEDNKAMLNILESDARERSFIFIGCSLDKEIDLMLVAAKHRFEKSIFIQKGKPSLSNRKNLETYGIKTIIWFDEYNQIYSWLNSVIDDSKINTPPDNIKISLEDTKRESVIKYIAHGGPILRNGDEVRLSPTSIQRTLISEIRTELRDHDVLLVEGRRFSGKTTLAFDIYQNFTEYKSFIFHNNIIGDTTDFEQQLHGEGKLFIIDTDSIHYSKLNYILSKLQKRNKIILFAKSIDTNHLNNILGNSNVSHKTFTLPDRLNNNESTKINVELDKLGIMNYDIKKTLLDNAWSFCEQYSSDVGDSTLFKNNINPTLFKILFLLQSNDYIDENMIKLACNERYISIDEIIRDSGVLLEKTINQNTPYISCNAKTWSISALEGKVINMEKKAQLIAECIQSLVYNGYTDTADDLIRFSKLNEIFGGMNHGASSLIRLVHLNIQSTFSESSHYWLQKSKCELIAGKTKEDIMSGILDSKKVINDNKQPKNRTYYSAILVLAQLKGREHLITGEPLSLVEMLDLYLESFRNRENNIGYIEKIRQQYKERKGDVFKSISALKEGKSGAAGLARKTDVDYLIAELSS